ncbi:hypothetical protein J1605_011909 [Eschrichtius robustus]|uniref:Uncharacterized protein n=1 Tax=Eschrichtius robustus TaxID=9764 RepID=A0AB34GL37_ESCRO|nr:hypothetical protein J1605_011909 [Eschrichtius robustus]
MLLPSRGPLRYSGKQILTWAGGQIHHKQNHDRCCIQGLQEHEGTNAASLLALEPGKIQVDGHPWYPGLSWDFGISSQLSPSFTFSETQCCHENCLGEKAGSVPTPSKQLFEGSELPLLQDISTSSPGTS